MTNLLKSQILLFLLLCLPISICSISFESYVSFNSNGGFGIITAKTTCPLIVSSNDYPGVQRVANELITDVCKVTGKKPQLFADLHEIPENIVIAGTLGHNVLIDRLVAEGKLDVADIQGKWEVFKVLAIKKPFPGIESALVIVGSDKRGTIYGLYDISEQIGVSPWNWWADVPVAKHNEIWVKPGSYSRGEPAVKYRGIFINDEAPALSTWSRQQFGGFNSRFYTRVFDLILRLRANYLWPAMWGSAFNTDDPLNPQLADEYGVIMGTSHHEPMIRSQQEWKNSGSGAWNYVKNKDGLSKFWEDGIARNKNFESIVTIGMRGDGDEPMTDSKDMNDNVKLLENIVADQRNILSKYYQQGVQNVPQIWALYKEVQSYYEHGMRVPDDITLLWCDDNWGNIRRVPSDEERKRSGGAGIYYHFDYVGGPRSYKWINTNQTAKIWEQMTKAYAYGTDRLWIVNVGDIKPLEYPIEFFMDLAWNPSKLNKDKIQEHCLLWCKREFGEKYAPQIASILELYSKYNSRRKPELLDATTYSLINYNEFENAVNDYVHIANQADSIYHVLPAEYADAFYQLVLYPVKASANLHQLYFAQAKNKFYASVGAISANFWADKVNCYFKNDSILTLQYHMLNNAKWNGMMNQSHIGYKSWNDPPRNVLPKTIVIQTNDKCMPAIVADGFNPLTDSLKHDVALPVMSAFTRRSTWVDLMNKGTKPFKYKIKVSDKWICTSSVKGVVKDNSRINISVDWRKIPTQDSINGEVKIFVSGKTFSVKVAVSNPQDINRESLRGFIESEGVVAIDAEHYTSKTTGQTVSWEKVTGLGRTSSAMIPFPVNHKPLDLKTEENALIYSVYFLSTGEFPLQLYISPTINFIPGQSLKIAVSVDDQSPKVLEMKAGTINGTRDDPGWDESVRNSIRKLSTSVVIGKRGYHQIKVLMIDPIVALQRIVVNTGGEKKSYLGPQESFSNLGHQPR